MGQPGPEQGTSVQCTIVRDKSSKMYPKYTLMLDSENRWAKSFLLPFHPSKDSPTHTLANDPSTQLVLVGSCCVLQSLPCTDIQQRPGWSLAPPCLETTCGVSIFSANS